MKHLSLLILVGLAAALPGGSPSPAQAGQTTHRTANVMIPEPFLAQKGGRQYPYYGNAPDDMLPYRRVEPYYRYWLTRLPFRGPGSDYLPPADLKSLKVGLLSPPPYGPEAARGESSRKGVLLAFEEANAARQPGQLPFQVIEKVDSSQWGSAANIAVEFYDDHVLGFVGTIDGNATHVALRVALKTETFIINCSDPDPTLTETQIPWLLRVFPDNRQEGYRLARHIVNTLGLTKIVVLRTNSRPGRVGVRPFVDAVRRLGHPVLQEINFQEGDLTFDTQVSVLQQAKPEAVVFWGNPPETGRAAAQLRRAGVSAAFFGFDRLVDGSFVKLAGAAAEGTTAAYFFDPDKSDAAWRNFSQRFQKRYGIKPGIYAGYAYDGANILIAAIKKAGPNRFRVQKVISGLDKYRGVTGWMRFDGRWDNIAPIVLARCKQGRWQFEPAREAAK